MGFPLDLCNTLFLGYADTHTCFGFSFFNHSQNLDFKTKKLKYLISILFYSPKKSMNTT